MLHTHTSDTQLFALSQLQMVKAKYDANKLTRKKKVRSVWNEYTKWIFTTIRPIREIKNKAPTIM